MFEVGKQYKQKINQDVIFTCHGTIGNHGWLTSNKWNQPSTYEWSDDWWYEYIPPPKMVKKSGWGVVNTGRNRPDILLNFVYKTKEEAKKMWDDSYCKFVEVHWEEEE